MGIQDVRIYGKDYLAEALYLVVYLIEIVEHVLQVDVEVEHYEELEGIDVVHI